MLAALVDVVGAALAISVVRSVTQLQVTVLAAERPPSEAYTGGDPGTGGWLRAT